MMAKMGLRLDKFIAQLSSICAGMGATFLIIIMIMVTVNVLSRNLFNYPILNIEEIAGYLFVAAVYLMMVYATRQGKNIQIELVVRHLPRKAREGLEVLTLLGILFLMVVYFRFSTRMWIDAMEIHKVSTSGLEFPQWIPQTFVVAGFFFICLELVAEVFKKFVAFRRGFRERRVEVSSRGQPPVSEVDEF